MKPAKMSDKNNRKKNYTGLQETASIHCKTLFPATWSLHLFLIQTKSLPKYVATLVFDLVSPIMVSPLSSVKGLTIPNSTQDFLKIRNVKEKSSAVSHSMLCHLQQPQQLEPSFTIAGNICMATKRQLLHQDPSSFRMNMLLFHAKVTTLLRC